MSYKDELNMRNNGRMWDDLDRAINDLEIITAEREALRAELAQAREALKQIQELANYDIDHEEDGNTYQIEAIACAALEDK